MNIDTIFYTQIGSVIAFISSVFLLYRLLVKQKDATIELQKSRIDWLDQQLKTAKENSPDTVVDILGKRITVQEAELKRLATDRDATKADVDAKEAELIKTKGIFTDLKTAVSDFEKKYEELKSRVDVCPYCDAELVQLKDIHDEDWTGSYRKYDCGFTQLDGDTVLLCPHDPQYPKFEQLKLTTEYDKNRKKWSSRYSDVTMKTWRLPMTVTHGKTKRQAEYLMQIVHEGRLDNESSIESQS